jgi:FkbM family methyltransferase
MPKSLLDLERFLPIANHVALCGVRHFVELDAHDIYGAECAMRLGVTGHIHVPETAKAEHYAKAFPDVHFYEGDATTFLKVLLPTLTEPAFFLVDDDTPDGHIAMIEAASTDKEWFIEKKPSKNSSAPKPQEPVPPPENPFDKSEEFDRTWSGPPEKKPRVYRTQSEKDTWYAVAVENEYNLGPLAPEDLVVDVGAHIGSFSWLAYQQGSRRIVGFEPDPWHLEAALENTRDMGIVIAHCAIVRGDDERKKMYYYNGGWNVMAEDGVLVDSMSLDEIIASLGPIRFLKLDCEGHEFEILRSCTRLAGIAEIGGEYHENAGRDSITGLCRFLRESGFALVGYRENAPGIGNFWACA